MGIQFGGDDPFNSPNPDANFFSSVDGNYGFGDAWATPGDQAADGSPVAAHPGSGSEPLTPGDYIVKVEIPNDPIQGRPLYTPTREEDVNVFTGDSFKPAYPPPPCVGRAAHGARHEPGLHRLRRQPVRRPGPSTLRRQARAGARREVDRPELRALHGRAGPRRSSGASSTTTSTSRSIPRRRSSARSPASATRLSASTTSPTA